MAFEYGSQEIKIGNPFKFQGLLALLNGIVFLCLGVGLFLYMSSMNNTSAKVPMVDKTVLVLYFLVATILTTKGFFGAIKGLFMITKFFVGRGMPADLAYEITKGDDGYRNNPGCLFYDAEYLEKSLKNRTNPAYTEPRGLLSRLLHTINPGFLYLPIQLRNVTQIAFETVVFHIGILVLFGLSILSGFLGVSNFIETSLWLYIGWLYVIEMFFISLKRIPNKKMFKTGYLLGSTIKELTFLIILAILGPLVGIFLPSGALPVLTVSPIPLLILITLSSVLSFAVLYFLALLRVPETAPRTEVSEFREQWEETVNPQEIFRNVDMTLANYRYLEISNRKYVNFDPELVAHAKGEFSGSLLQETQPIPCEIKQTQKTTQLNLLKRICAITGQVASFGAGLSAFLLVLLTSPAQIISFAAFSNLVGVLVLGIFGQVLQNVAHLYLGEIRFKSKLFYFFADGTFNKSKISTGMSVYDSNRSENELVRTSIRPWIYCADIESTTFAISGHYNLEQIRTILEYQKNDQWMNEIVNSLKTYLSERKKIADAMSQDDLTTTAKMAQINTQINSLRNGTLAGNDNDEILKISGNQPKEDTGPTES